MSATRFVGNSSVARKFDQFKICIGDFLQLRTRVKHLIEAGLSSFALCSIWGPGDPEGKQRHRETHEKDKEALKVAQDQEKQMILSALHVGRELVQEMIRTSENAEGLLGFLHLLESEALDDAASKWAMVAPTLEQSAIRQELAAAPSASFEKPGNANTANAEGKTPKIPAAAMPGDANAPHLRGNAINTGNPAIDVHVNGLLDNLRNESPVIKAEFATLVPVLEFLSSYLWLAAHGGHCKKITDIDENQFRQIVLNAMREKLGPEVTEHPSQAGGIPDIRYRGVIVELKVEKGNGDRDTICRKYREQPTQYAASEARQVSIVLVLDLTTKERPPADIRNDIHLVDVPTHGGSDETKKYPSKAFVLFVNGNLRSPSSYS